MAENSDSTNPREWTLFQMLVRIIQRRAVSPEEAEEFYYSPENRKIVAWASDVLAATLHYIIYETVEGLPIGAVHVLRGSRYEDLATLLSRQSLGSIYAAAEILELKQIIMRSVIKFDPRWGNWIPWPVPPPALTTRAEALPLEPASALELASESTPETESALESAPELESAPASTSADAPESPDHGTEESRPRDAQPLEPDLIDASTPTLVSATQATPAPTQPPESAVAQQAEPISSSEVEPEEPRAPNGPGPVDAPPPTTPASSYGYAAGTRRVFETPTSAPSQSGTPGGEAEELPPRDAQPPQPAPIPMVFLLYDQMVIWIALRRVVSPEEAERLVTSPEMAPKIERAKKELDRVWRAELGRALAKYDEFVRVLVEEGRIPPALSEDDDIFRILGLEGRTYSTTRWVDLCRTGRLPADDVGLNDVTWDHIPRDHIAGVLEGFKRKWPANSADVPATGKNVESPTTLPAENSGTVPPAAPGMTPTLDAPASETPPAPEQPSAHGQPEGVHEDALSSDTQSNESADAAPGSRTQKGRHQQSFWPEVENYIFDVLTRRGLPSPDKPKLPNQAALEDLVADFLQNNQWDAVESTIRAHVVGMLEYFERRGR
jgi:hypothetical protein